MKKLLLLYCGMLSISVLAHTREKGLADAAVVDNTNNVAIAILEYASMDNDDVLDEDEQIPVRYTDWDGLLDGVSFPGLTRQDKDVALYDYLMKHSTNDLSGVGGDIRELIRVGLCEYRDLNHTNALPIVRNFLANPTADYMNEPAYIYYKWASIDDEYLVATTAFLSNTSTLARVSKAADIVYLEGSINRHIDAFGCDARYTNAVNLVYGLRYVCPEGAVVLDRMFVSKMSRYEFSSNRLETVISWLNATNVPAENVSYCVGVTNQLLNAEQPLVQIEIP